MRYKLGVAGYTMYGVSEMGVLGVCSVLSLSVEHMFCVCLGRITAS